MHLPMADIDWLLQPGYVYFIEAAGSRRIKIGWSATPWKRIAELSTACPFPLELLKVTYGARQTERWWHHKYDDLRVHLEWFKAAPRLRKAIALTADAPVIDPAADSDGRAA